MYWRITGRRVHGGVFLGGATGPNGLLIWTMGLMEGMVVWQHLKKTSIDFVFLINKKKERKKREKQNFCDGSFRYFN